jgi:hypothetical protein
VQNHEPGGYDLPSVSIEATIDLAVGDANTQQLVATACLILAFSQIPQPVTSLGVEG